MTQHVVPFRSSSNAPKILCPACNGSRIHAPVPLFTTKNQLSPAPHILSYCVKETNEVGDDRPLSWNITDLLAPVAADIWQVCVCVWCLLWALTRDKWICCVIIISGASDYRNVSNGTGHKATWHHQSHRGELEIVWTECSTDSNG